MRLSEFSKNLFMNGEFITDFKKHDIKNITRLSNDLDKYNIHKYISKSGDYLYDLISAYDNLDLDKTNKYLITNNFLIYKKLKKDYNIRFIPFWFDYKKPVGSINESDIFWCFPHDNVTISDLDLVNLKKVFNKVLLDKIDSKTNIYFRSSKKYYASKNIKFKLSEKTSYDTENCFKYNFIKYPKSIKNINHSLSYSYCFDGEYVLITNISDAYANSILLFLGGALGTDLIEVDKVNYIDTNMSIDIIHNMNKKNNYLLYEYKIDLFDSCKDILEAVELYNNLG